MEEVHRVLGTWRLRFGTTLESTEVFSEQEGMLVHLLKKKAQRVVKVGRLRCDMMYAVLCWNDYCAVCCGMSVLCSVTCTVLCVISPLFCVVSCVCCVGVL